MKHVLITGGAGFIGSHLCDYYVSKGFQVTALDNFLTGTPKNIEHLSSQKNFKLIQHDVSQSLPENEIGPVHFVLHFACPASPIDFTRLPLEIMKVDSYGTFNMLDFALKNKARFVLASTSEIYGDPLVHPQKEDYWGNVNTTGKRSCYDEAKRFSEAATMVYHRKHKLNTGIVRIFNTYGPRMRLDDGRVVPNFCGQALRGQPLTVYGTGLQTRSFCFVDDLIDGITQLVSSDIHEPVNIGNADEYKILDFAHFILKTVPHTKSTVVFKPLLHDDDPKQRRPDISRAQKLLNWSPKVPLSEGMTRTLEYFKTLL